MLLVWPSCYELMAHLAVTPLRIPLHIDDVSAVAASASASSSNTSTSMFRGVGQQGRERGDFIPV